MLTLLSLVFVSLLLPSSIAGIALAAALMAALLINCVYGLRHFEACMAKSLKLFEGEWQVGSGRKSGQGGYRLVKTFGLPGVVVMSFAPSHQPGRRLKVYAFQDRFSESEWRLLQRLLRSS